MIRLSTLEVLIHSRQVTTKKCSLIYGLLSSYEYDSNGNRTAMSAVVGTAVLTTSFTYDALNRLETVTDPDGRVYHYKYDGNGNRISVKQATGIETIYTYDVRNRLTGLVTRTSEGEVLQSYIYSLGPAGNRTRIENHEGVVYEYSYDQLYRLVNERATVCSELFYEYNFSYDPVGNRLTQLRTDESGSTLTTYSYDGRDRLLTAGNITYTWDQNGNLASKSGGNGAIYSWDFEDRLVKIISVDHTVIEYAYDAEGNRVKRSVTPSAGTSVITNFLVDPSGPISHDVAESDSNDNLSAYYIRGAELLTILRPDDARFYATDGLGSVRLLTDMDENVTDRYNFSAYGEMLGHTGQDLNDYLYTGQRFDSLSGFYYLRARWLDPTTGRFTTMDPVLGQTSNPVSFHNYIYADANPLNNWDPLGETTTSFNITVAALAVAALIVTIPTYMFYNTFKMTPVKLRPVIHKDSSWAKWAVERQIEFARYVFHSQATNIYFNVSDITVERTGLGASIDEKQGLELIYKLHEKNTLTLIFLDEIRSGTIMVGGVIGAITTMDPIFPNEQCRRRRVRGVVMALVTARNDAVLAHELGHAIGCLDHSKKGPRMLMWPYYVGGQNVSISGTTLDSEEVDQLRCWAGTIP